MENLARSAASWLFVPGDRPDRHAKALASKADIVICDLEDAVALPHKDNARRHVARLFAGGAVAAVRVNASDTEWYERDIAALAPCPGLIAVIVPKSEDPSALRALYERLPEGVAIIPLIESARGLASATEIASVAGVSRLAFGSIDFALDLGCEETPDALLHARSSLVFSSRLAGAASPIDGVSVQVSDLKLLTEHANKARSLGFAGKLCIHPGQVDSVNAAFAPRHDEVSWATHVFALEAEPARGSVAIDGMMVDAPIRERAQRILLADERHRRPPNWPRSAGI